MEKAKVALGAQVDLAKNHFVRLLNGKTPGLGPVIPPSKEIDRLREQGRLRVERAYVRAKAHSKELGGDKELQQKIGKLEQKLRKAKRNLENAFPIEEEALETVCQRLEDDLNKLRRSAKSIQQASSTRQGNTAADTLRRKFDKLLVDFPGAQILDLSVLSHFKNKKGLPAVSLFSLEAPGSAVCVWPADQRCRIYTGDRSQNIVLDDTLHAVSMKNLRVQIQKATGVGGTGSSLSASQIQLKTSFPSGQVIPEKARRIIRHAQDSKKFRWVGLLAEVKEWEVDYYELYGKGEPKIDGSIYNPPKTKDPLIVASAMIGKRQYWFVLGAFDTTPIEKLIHDEFSTNPRA